MNIFAPYYLFSYLIFMLLATKTAKKTAVDQFIVYSVHRWCWCHMCVQKKAEAILRLQKIIGKSYECLIFLRMNLLLSKTISNILERKKVRRPANKKLLRRESYLPFLINKNPNELPSTVELVTSQKHNVTIVLYTQRVHSLEVLVYIGLKILTDMEGKEMQKHKKKQSVIRIRKGFNQFPILILIFAKSKAKFTSFKNLNSW